MPDGNLSDWFVVRTQPRRERWAAENVARAGYNYYLPEVLETVRIVQGGRRRREFQVKPLFPSYLFAQHATGQWHELLRTFGVVAIVQGSGGYPGLLSAAAIAQIRAWAGSDGVVRLPITSFQPNQRATITSGAYAGFTGLVQGYSANERVQILLDYMGRKVPFIVREAHLEAAA